LPRSGKLIGSQRFQDQVLNPVSAVPGEQVG